MIKSGKPKKQRSFRFNAPLHVRQHFVHAHIDKQLKKRLSLKKSSVQISRGDTVKVMSGGNKGKTGKVTSVDLRTGRVRIDSLTKKNARGKEYNLSVNASNVYITDLNLTDKYRAAKLKVAVVKAEPKKEEAKPKIKPVANADNVEVYSTDKMEEVMKQKIEEVTSAQQNK
ncbi:MAG: 50S ribosomal protein L24 [Candidatus Micrarchaeaceae archaeon]